MNLNIEAMDIIEPHILHYIEGRIEFYEKTALSILFRKDLFMVAFRETTITGLIEFLFNAYESSSEEGVWGTTLQNILVEISGGIDQGDLTVQNGDTIWYISIAASTNTKNADALAQIIRTGKDSQDRGKSINAPSIKNHKVMSAIIRGPRSTETKKYAGTKIATKDLKGFEYTRMVGDDFTDWIMKRKGYQGYFWDYISNYFQKNNALMDKVKLKRQECIRDILNDMNILLSSLGLTDAITDLPNLTQRLPAGDPKTQKYENQLNDLIEKKTE